MLSLLVLYSSQYYEAKKEKIQSLVSEIEKTHNNFLTTVNYQSNFLMLETSKNQTFIKKQSVFQAKHDSSINSILEKISNIELNDNKLKYTLKDIKIKSIEYKNKSKTLTELVLERGYKDFGVEGKMREYAHVIENLYSKYINKEELLTLRRHEKDFIIRKEENYVRSFKFKIEQIQNELEANKDIPTVIKDELTNILNLYRINFLELVRLEKLIGYKENNGLISEVRIISDNIDDKYKALIKKGITRQKILLKKLKNYYHIGLMLFMFIAILASYRISISMTKRLLLLSESLNNFVSSDYKKRTNYNYKSGKDEVGKLAANFNILQEEIVNHFSFYRAKAEKRTNEIIKQKNELEQKQLLIKEKNKDILDSIQYAKKIQQSLLPKETYLNQVLKNYFIIFKPKDIVSGDFYWVDKRKDKIFIAVVDCTGHGVPGALMSVMGFNYLNQAIREKKLFKPNEILSYLNIAISSSLHQHSKSKKSFNSIVSETVTTVDDGMDISLAVIDTSTNTLSFSGAQRPLIHIRENELIEYKGEKSPIGGSYNSKFKEYNLDTIQLKKGDQIYLYSDGFSDQFGGENNKKFKHSKLKELLLYSRNEPIKIQKKIILEAHNLWKKNQEQVDDICMMGIKI